MSLCQRRSLRTIPGISPHWHIPSESQIGHQWYATGRTAHQLARQAGYDPVLFGYTDTANDPRFFDPDNAILKSYEGPLPGINPVVQMGTYPDAWTDWLEAKGQTIPDPNFRLYTDKTSASEYEDGGNCPAPMKVTAEHHDTYFVVDQVIDYLKQQDKPWCVHLSLLRPPPLDRA